jgi:hypothetical protein
MYSCISTIDAVKYLVLIFHYKYEKLNLHLPIFMLRLNFISHIVALVMIHVYRLNHGGKVCSGDYITNY